MPLLYSNLVLHRERKGNVISDIIGARAQTGTVDALI